MQLFDEQLLKYEKKLQNKSIAEWVKPMKVENVT